MNNADVLQTLYRIVENAIDNLKPGGIAMINQVPVCNAETEHKFRAWCAIKGVEVIEFHPEVIVVRRVEVR